MAVGFGLQDLITIHHYTFKNTQVCHETLNHQCVCLYILYNTAIKPTNWSYLGRGFTFYFKGNRVSMKVFNLTHDMINMVFSQSKLKV